MKVLITGFKVYEDDRLCQLLNLKYKNKIEIIFNKDFKFKNIF